MFGVSISSLTLQKAGERERTRDDEMEYEHPFAKSHAKNDPHRPFRCESDRPQCGQRICKLVSPSNENREEKEEEEEEEDGDEGFDDGEREEETEEEREA